MQRPLSCVCARLAVRSFAAPLLPAPVARPSLVSNRHASTSTSPSSAAATGASPATHTFPANPWPADKAGPFPLPNNLGQESLLREERLRKAERSWGQLKGKEKFGRAASNSGHFLLVLLGGSVAGLVCYSAFTELGSSNSPTRIYEDCIHRLDSSAELKTVLIPPYSYHGSNSTNRLRRNRHISSQLTVDPITGEERMKVLFWVESQPVDVGKKPEEEEGWLWNVKKWVGPLIWDDSHSGQAYVPTPTPPAPAPAPIPAGWGSWLANGVSSLFGALVPSTAAGGKGTKVAFRPFKPKRGEYTSGEAVAVLKKDPESGQFVYETLTVFIPEQGNKSVYKVEVPTATVVGEAQKGEGWTRFWSRR